MLEVRLAEVRCTLPIWSALVLPPLSVSLNPIGKLRSRASKKQKPQRAQRCTEGPPGSHISSGAKYAFGAIGLGAGIGGVIALAIEGDDEHGASVAIALGLVGSDDRHGSSLRRDVAGALAETTMAKLVSAAEEFDEEIRGVGSEDRLHGAVMLVAKR